MPAYSVCRKSTCATLVEGKTEACPKCGGPMRSVGESPLRGIVLLLCGLFLFFLLRHGISPEQRVMHGLLRFHHALADHLENLRLP